MLLIFPPSVITDDDDDDDDDLNGDLKVLVGIATTRDETRRERGGSSFLYEYKNY